MNQPVLPSRVSDAKLMLLCGLGWLLAGLLPAFFEYRFFYADGAYFFMWILDKREVLFAAEGRSLTYMITQWPVVAAIAAGCRDLPLLARCFGAGYMVPLILLNTTTLVLLWRRGLRLQAFLFMVMLWLLQGFSGLFTITDLRTSTAVFLFAVVLVASPVAVGVRSWVTLLVVAMMSFVMYEFWAFYAAVLIVVLLWRLLPCWRRMSRSSRWSWALLICLFAASIVVNVRRVFCTSIGSNRDSLLSMLFGTTYPAYLAVIGGWFIGLCGHLLISVRPDLCRTWRLVPRERTRVLMLLGSFLALVLLCAIQHNTMVRYSYPFRTLNLILPLIFTAWLMGMGKKAEGVAVPRSMRTLLVVATLLLIASETWMTLGWREYQAWAGDVQRQDGATYVSQEPRSPMAQAWIFPHYHSPHSFVSQALRSKSVKGIAYDPSAQWRPYGPGSEEAVTSIAARYGIGLE